MSGAPAIAVDVVSDVVCPWCYVGQKRLEKAIALLGEVEVRVRWRPFQLDPAAPAAAVPIGDYLERRFGRAARDMTATVSEAAAGEGLVFDWEHALAANTFTAHRLLRLAGIDVHNEDLHDERKRGR